MRRVVSLDRQTPARHAVRNSGQVAVIGGTEIEPARQQLDADGVEEPPAEDLDPHDRLTFRGELLLHETRPVQPEIDLCALELLGSREGADPGAAPSDVRLYEHREAEPRGGFGDESGIVDDARARKGQSEPREERALSRLRDLDLVGGVAVHDGRADLVEVPEVVECVEDGVAVTARPGGRAHAIESKRVRALPFT